MINQWNLLCNEHCKTSWRPIVNYTYICREEWGTQKNTIVSETKKVYHQF